MCFEYDEIVDMFESKTVRCRRNHKCRGCCRQISRGEIATCCSGLFDGSWFRYYICDRCERVTMAIAVREFREGCDWGAAWISPDDIADHCHYATQHGDPIEPLRLRTLEDCMRYVNDVWRSVKAGDNEPILLEAF